MVMVMLVHNVAGEGVTQGVHVCITQGVHVCLSSHSKWWHVQQCGCADGVMSERESETLKVRVRVRVCGLVVS